MAASEARPTVIADDVHVRYQVLATGRRAKNAPRRLMRRPGSGPRRLREVHALRGVSFVAREGEAIGVVGHNGSGKSTLLRTIAGLTKPSEGGIYADGEPTLLGVGAALINELSGERNITLGGLALGMSPEEVAEKYDDIVEFAGLEEFIEYPMRTYSSGMQARLRFAIAASATHQVLLIDEALAVGDEGFRRRSEKRIEELRGEAGTVFLVSHSLNTVINTCSRVLWLHKGELRRDGPAEEVIAAYRKTTNAK